MSDNTNNGFPVPEEPLTREEQYLSAIAGVTEATEIPEKPLTRVEAYLNEIVENGGGGGGGGTVNNAKITIQKNGTDVESFTLNQSTDETINITVPTSAADVSAIPTTAKGANSGVAELDANGKIPSSQLPSYVDDVIEGYYYDSKFYEDSEHTTEITGTTGKIYVDLLTNKTYRWSGSGYTEISESLALGETSSTAYRGDRGKTAYDHATDSSRLTTAQSSGLYKIATTSEGHVASVAAVAKSDITALGIPAQDTTYESKSAASGGTDVSLVTTGEKYTWNGKQNAIDSSHKLSADLVDDTSTTNKFATAAELEQIETNKNNISLKADKPITNLVYVQTSSTYTLIDGLTQYLEYDGTNTSLYRITAVALYNNVRPTGIIVSLSNDAAHMDDSNNLLGKIENTTLSSLEITVLNMNYSTNNKPIYFWVKSDSTGYNRMSSTIEKLR